MKQQAVASLNKIIVLIVMFMGTALAAPDHLDVQFEEIVFNPDDAKRNESWGTPAERQEMIRRLRVRLNDTDYHTRSVAQRGLLILDDEPSIARMMPGYRAGEVDVSADFALYARGAALPYVVAEIERGSTKWEASGAHFAPLKIRATATTLRCIQNTKDFPSESRAWATDTSEKLGLYSTRVHEQATAQVLQWWEHNRVAVEGKDYAKATWIPRERISLDFIVKGHDDPRPSPPALPPGYGKLTPKVSAGETARPSAISETGWGWIVVTFVLLGGSLWVWKRRFTRN